MSRDVILLGIFKGHAGSCRESLTAAVMAFLLKNSLQVAHFIARKIETRNDNHLEYIENIGCPDEPARVLNRATCTLCKIYKHVFLSQNWFNWSRVF